MDRAWYYTDRSVEFRIKGGPVALCRALQGFALLLKAIHVHPFTLGCVEAAKKGREDPMVGCESQNFARACLIEKNNDCIRRLTAWLGVRAPAFCFLAK